MRAEFALFAAALALSLVALLVASRPSDKAWRVPTAVLFALLATIGPLLLYQFLNPALAAGRALWEWSAAGGPTIQASYRLDGIGAVGVAACSAYVSAGLLAAIRSASAPRPLPALVLGVGFVSLAVVVTNDVVAATVALAVLAALTVFVTLLVAPAPSAIRLAAYFAVGLQGFVVAALLIARQGGPSLALAAISPNAISPGAVVAATVGAALFAGLYPFVPWRYQRARESTEREPLRGVLAMPAGIAASLLLMRILGATSIDLSTLGLPAIDPSPRFVLTIAVLVWAAVRARLRGRVSARLLIATTLAIAAFAAYPWLHWSHLVVAGALLTVLYAAAVSLALPEEWEVARHDVTLATLWVAVAAGTPLSLAAGLFVLVGAGFAAIAESVWLAPHRAYIAAVATATWTVTGIIAVGIGALGAPDRATAIGVIVVIALVLVLELLHAGRRLALGDAPIDLEIAAAAAALIGTTLLAIVTDAAIPDAVAVLGRPLEGLDPVITLTTVVVATILVVAAGAVRPLVPDLDVAVSALQRFVWAADPVPTGTGAFRALERAVTLASSGFTLFEERAGVWLATVFIVALLVWSTRQ